MKAKVGWLKLLVAFYGEIAGIALIGLVSIWDLLITGLRGFFEWKISGAGLIAIYLGIVLIIASKHISKNG